MADEDEIRSRTSAHVRANSHARGGGHHETLLRFKGKPAKVSHMTAGLPVIDGWDHSGLDIDPFEQDMSDETQGTEWPKWVWPGGTPGVGEGFLCQTPAEEAEILGAGETKEDLQAKAEALGIEVDGRWGIERLRTAINEATS